jgi:hypothetical protein
MSKSEMIIMDTFPIVQNIRIVVEKSNWKSGAWLNVNGECIHLSKDESTKLIEMIKSVI